MEASREAWRRLQAVGGGIAQTDWRDAVFFNLAVPPAVLQPIVPFPLDLYEGSAYVSVVAFDQQRFRTSFAQRLLSPLVRPFGSHLFCNLRAYVRCGEEPGVHFMREWVPNPVGTLIAPRTYGLPFRLASLHYEHDRADGLFFGRVTAKGLSLGLRATIDYGTALGVPAPGSLDDFLMERYTGFQTPGPLRLRFRIWHVPWPYHAASGEIVEDALLRGTGGWYASARLVSVLYSPGVEGVHIGLPNRAPC
jgi:uncharacterized protein YqjF (DUF2071 family)